MAGWREERAAALADIHEQFEIAAVYLTSPTATPIRVNVRLHQKHAISEQTLAEWGNGASLLDMTDRIIFSDSEVPFVHARSYVIFGANEVYLTGPSRPKREGYTGAEVSNLDKDDIAKLILLLDVSDPAYEGILA